MKKSMVYICIVFLILSCAAKNQAKHENLTPNIKEKLPEELLDESVLKSENSEDLYITGIVIEIIENEGTFSEVRYFVLADDTGVKTILFNEKGFSEGFKVWIGKKVIVQGYNDAGLIGFKRERKTGFVVVKIHTVE